jgi:hypothetical protein
MAEARELPSLIRYVLLRSMLQWIALSQRNAGARPFLARSRQGRPLKTLPVVGLCKAQAAV